MLEFDIPEEQINTVINFALAEDSGHGDVTSEAIIPANLEGTAALLVKAEGVLAGGEVFRKVFAKIDPTLKIEILIPDGMNIKHGDIAVTISGKVRSILKGERTALNFIQRLSGIATLTRQYVNEISGTRAGIYDTRKTTPGLRLLEKYAVRAGGGRNHRLHLGDAVLIKDNHLAALRKPGLSFKEIMARAKQNAPRGIIIEIEVTTPQEAQEAAAAGANIVMLDNMSLEAMQEAVKLVRGRCRIEASGGINLSNVRQVATTGVDIISIGALTHSPKALDISLELEPESMKLS
ncbi:MAG: carboxylating nicotinate-nucleotide diphosphorylase [Dehalococcoidales bacterium]|nr:carboxylating nicotinate-nucleotide diphosphorylase [Dehalococcoidales bacterium]